MSAELHDDLVAMAQAQHARPEWLGLVVDNRRLFDALQDGWLHPQPGHPGTLVGVNAHLREVQEPEGNCIPVQIKVDAAKLPDNEVAAYRDGDWQPVAFSEARASDGALLWPGALPLFSIADLRVPSEEQRVRLTSLGKHISNVEVPDVSVGCGCNTSVPSSPPPAVNGRISIPERHDAIRGAITMALWALPRVDPWLNLLCEALSAHPQNLSNAAKAVDASWWRFPPWVRSIDACPSGSQERLWRAASQVFKPGCTGTEELVDGIADLARQGAADDCASDIEEWRSTTRRILRAEASIQHDRWRDRPVGLAIQLVLARPEPTAFKTWFDDDRGSLPPAVAWSAAVLCGLLHGYRRLDTRFRGKEAQREVVAVQSLWLCADEVVASWPGVSHDLPAWRRKAGNFILSWGGRDFACKHEQERGKWYRADFASEAVRRDALEVTNAQGWPCHRRVISFGTGVRPTFGSGLIEPRNGEVEIRDEIRIQLLPKDGIRNELDVDAFRLHIATEPGRLAAPPEPVHRVGTPESSQEMPGLTLIPDFISETEEEEILAKIEQSEWSTELKRRVQHYGWQYGYKSRRIDPSMHIGPLPDWANEIARRLVDRGYFQSGLPDQVIVNEYLGDQGISPHVDSPSFTDVVATVSLLESWEMEFRKKRSKTKVVRRLERRSATILEGDARHKWTHEIRKRRSEPGPLKPGNKNPSRISRGRRISLTFRKVANMAGNPNS